MVNNQIAQNLQKFSFEFRLKAAKKALRKGANLLRKEITKNAAKLDRSQTANSIAANVKIQYAGKSSAKSGNVIFRVGIAGGKI